MKPACKESQNCYPEPHSKTTGRRLVSPWWISFVLPLVAAAALFGQQEPIVGPIERTETAELRGHISRALALAETSGRYPQACGSDRRRGYASLTSRTRNQTKSSRRTRDHHPNTSVIDQTGVCPFLIRKYALRG